MVRVLHLSDSLPDFSAERSSAALAQHVGDAWQIETRSIGRGGDYGNAPLAFLGLRGGAIEEFDVVHAWSFTALWVAALSGERPIIFTPSQALPGRSMRWLGAAMRRREVHLVCSSDAERDFYLRNRIDPQRCSVIRPGTHLGRNTPRRDPALRAALGLADADYVLLAPGESTRASGHREALWSTAILHELDPCYRILTWGRGPMMPLCVRLAGKFRQPTTLVTARQKLGREIEFAELLPAADAVLFVPTGPTPILPLAICMAAGLPIIATACPWTGDLLQDGENSTVIPRFSSPAVAQRVIELRQDAALELRIRKSASAGARELFALDRFVEQYKKLYLKLKP